MKPAARFFCWILLLGTLSPLALSASPPVRRNLVVRIPVAHLHDRDSAACYGHLYFSGDRIRYQVARPVTAAADSFDAARAEVGSAQPAGSASMDLRLTRSETFRFTHLTEAGVAAGRHDTSAALPVQDLLAAANHFAELAAELDSGGQRPRGAPGLSVAIQKLVTDPGGAEVLVDGVAWGATDPQTGELILRGLPFGERSFVLRRPGYDPVRFPVRYEHERTGEIFAPLKALHPEPVAGSLLLEDVLDMTDGGVPAERIVAMVRRNGVALDLIGDADRPLAAAAGNAQARRKQLADLLIATAAHDARAGNYGPAIRALEFTERLHPADSVVREALRRTRRAQQTEREVLSRR